MNLDYLKTYLKLVKLGSFSAVAKKLSISQPAVSFQMQKLERDLGVRLINRGQKKITMTDAGKRLLKFANTVDDETVHLQHDLDSLRQEVTGELAIIASTIPGEFVLPPILGEFMTLHPTVTAQVTISDSLAVISRVRENAYEVGFCGVSPPKNQGLEFFKTAEDEIVLIVPPGHPFARRRAVPFAELEKAPLISREATSGTQKSLEALLLKAGLNPGGLTTKLYLGSTQAIASAVESGAGIAFISNLAIKKSLELGTVCQIAVGKLKLKRNFYCVYYKERVETRLLKEFLAFARTRVTTSREVEGE
jgi:DNA-binding transcriptional LysR family regulator